jgi:DNA polymerase III delta prime subunit
VDATEIVGRDDELRTISSFVEQSSPASALLIEGEPGIGKTTLWRAGVAAAHAQSYCVLQASPAEKEATFSHSVVSDLLADVPHEVFAGLPGPQRRALEVALLIRDSGGPPPEQHTLGVALLGVLRALSTSQPLVLAVDDVQ